MIGCDKCCKSNGGSCHIIGLAFNEVDVGCKSGMKKQECMYYI